MGRSARLCRTLLSLSVLAHAACDSNKPPTTVAPTPTPTPATITAVTVSGISPGLAVGQSVQLTASVVRSDGSRSDATTNATWQSSDAAVATVSPAGLLTVTGFGDADVVATIDSVRGTAHLSVLRSAPPSPRYDITGVVHETLPTTNVPVSGATVGVHFVGCPTCPHDNETTTTDAAGQFTLAGIETAGFALIVSKPGYEAASYNVAVLPRDQRADIALAPDATPTTSQLSGDLCADSGYWLAIPLGCNTSAPMSRHHSIAVHRAGTLEIHANWVYEEDYSSEFMRLEVRCGGATVTQEYWLGLFAAKYQALAEATRILRTGPTAYTVESGPLRVSVASASLCEITPQQYSSFKGGAATTNYRIDVTHPR